LRETVKGLPAGATEGQALLGEAENLIDSKRTDKKE
jgi:hypothetical protein